MSASPYIMRRVLATSALVLGLMAALADRRGEPAPIISRAAATAPTSPAAARDWSPRTVGAMQLAAWIRDGVRDLRVLDMRGGAAYERRHVPSAEPADFARLDSLAAQAGATVVLYSGDDVRDAQAWATLDARGHREAYVLSGGMDAWLEDVMAPVLRGDSADHVAALSRYFGGVPRAGEPSSRAEGTQPRAQPEPTQAERDDEGLAGRRGC